MIHTHQKRPYKAKCTQYTGDNRAEIIALLSDSNTFATKYSEDCIMVRFNKAPPGGRSIETLTPGWWIVIGENLVTKCYDDATFRLKYKAIT